MGKLLTKIAIEILFSWFKASLSGLTLGITVTVAYALFSAATGVSL